MAGIIITEQEMCDCAACPGSRRMAARAECGCDEDICPECGCCEAHCEGHYDDDWDAEEYDNAPEPPEPTGVIDRKEYFWATYDYDDDEDDEPPF